jgi:hypothetical protein
MSSARANAAARSRRAGGAEFPTPSGRPGQPSQVQGQQMQGQQMPQGPVKLSISDAIALITLRLGRVENIVQVIRNDPVSGSGDDNQVSVDETVFANIVERIEELEKFIMESPSQHENENIETLKEIIFTLQNELTEVKQSLSKLQAFTMETNQKLIGAVLNNASAPSLLPFGLSASSNENLSNNFDE